MLAFQKVGFCKPISPSVPFLCNIIWGMMLQKKKRTSIALCNLGDVTICMIGHYHFIFNNCFI